MAATPVSVVTDGVTGLETDLLGVAAAGIGVGAVVFAIRKGWRLIKGMI